MPPTGNSNPFDFSDFGGRAQAVASDGSPQGQRASGASGPATGFDPFAGHPQAPQTRPVPDAIFSGASAAAPSNSLTFAGPPLSLIAAAFAVAVLGVFLGLVALTDSTVLPAFAGWLLAGPAAIGILAWFTHVDTRRRLSSVYSAPTWLRTAYWGVVTTCALGIGVGAWQMALFAGRY